MVSREYDGLAGAGGVKDVCRQLAEAIVRQRKGNVRVVLPLYGFMDADQLGFRLLKLPVRKGCPTNKTSFLVDMNYPERERREEVSIWTKKMKGVQIYLLDAKRFREKMGVYTYTAEEEAAHAWQKQGNGHFDYFAMNILLQKATLALLILLNHRPDIIHCHDGHGATLPAMMRELPGYRYFFSQTGAVVTIHNAGLGYHQEVDDLDFARAVTGLPMAVINTGRLAGNFDPFMAASNYAILNTVSANYGRELRETPEDSRTGWLGHELTQRRVTLAGITNGINADNYNPAKAGKLGLPAPFNPLSGELDGKRICKERMLVSCGKKHAWPTVEQFGHLKPEPEVPLFTFIGRLTSQKGVDILLQAVPLLLEADQVFHLLILGTGNPQLEQRLQRLSKTPATRGRICFLKGYDQALATQIYAAGDFFLVPSLYEPCGLTDFIAQLLGNLPIVHYVGGLVKVVDGKTGFTYQDHSPTALARTMEKAIIMYNNEPDRLKKMQQQAIEQIHAQHTWDRVITKYLSLYTKAVGMCC